MQHCIACLRTLCYIKDKQNSNLPRYKTMNDDARAKGRWQGMNWIRKDKRLAIYLRDGMACMYCGSGIEDGVQLTLDHVTPHSQGGTNSETNLVTCCHKCNSVRSDRDVSEFAHDTAQYLGHDITGQVILESVVRHLAKSIRPYRIEAKAILSRRPTWQAALMTASK